MRSKKTVLFGSRTKSDFADASDIDIAFWSEKDDPGLWFEAELVPTNT